MGIVRFFFAAIIVLYILRLLIRLVLPLFLQKAVNKMANQYQNNNPRRAKPEGSISIDFMPPKQKQGNVDKLGEVVDYEEIKE